MNTHTSQGIVKTVGIPWRVTFAAIAVRSQVWARSMRPVLSQKSPRVFFNYRKTYLEHIVINAYITGQQAIFYTVFVLAGAVIDSEVVEGLSLLLVVSYAFWVFWQLFSTGNRLLNILRSILTYVLYLAFSMVLLEMFLLALYIHPRT